MEVVVTILVVLGILLIAAGMILGVDALIWLAYTHFADKFHCYHLSFWEVVVAMLVIGCIAGVVRGPQK